MFYHDGPRFSSRSLYLFLSLLSPPAGARLATLSRGKLDETLRAVRRRQRPRESRFGKEVASPNRNPRAPPPVPSENSPRKSAPALPFFPFPRFSFFSKNRSYLGTVGGTGESHRFHECLMIDANAFRATWHLDFTLSLFLSLSA